MFYVAAHYPTMIVNKAQPHVHDGVARLGTAIYAV